MGDKLLVIGESGSGKSRSAKSLDPASTFYINCIGKPLPFKGWKGKFSKDKNNYTVKTQASEVVKVLEHINKEMPQIKTVVVDDAQYIMSYEFMHRALEKGFDKFTEIGRNFFNVLTAPDTLRDDLLVVFLAHADSTGERTKIKTIGKMLDDKITLEGMFTVVLLAYSYNEDNEMKYVFVTQSNGSNTCKSPEGMFPSVTIDNDLNKVLDYYHKYQEEE